MQGLGTSLYSQWGLRDGDSYQVLNNFPELASTADWELELILVQKGRVASPAFLSPPSTRPSSFRIIRSTLIVMLCSFYSELTVVKRCTLFYYT